ncbi:uncharacterized protein [Eleutherodactylus coqui]|uniref:uncharacterized protein n=1 Tax=Eleutherodactylus coqui TaxID=57060 RepID=UPI0034627812
MDTILQLANESKLNFNVPKGQPLHNIWNSLWEQCEAANERLQNTAACFPKSNTKSIANAMKMLTVFQNEIKGRDTISKSSDSPLPTFTNDPCESCGLSKSKQKLLENNYDKRGKMIEYLLSQSCFPSEVAKGKQPSYEAYVYDEQLDNEEPGSSKDKRYMPKSTAFVQQRPYTQERETQSKENSTKILVQLLSNFTKYDPNKDPFTNMSLFEDECSQHNLGPRESCLMMKLWLPSQMSVRLAPPVARPVGGPQFWSNEGHWGDRQDRLKALVLMVTGDDDFGIDILEDLKVTPQDDPWEFSRKFEQAYRLVMGVKDSSFPPAMLKALVNKFTFLDCATRIAASKERTIDGIVKIVDKFRRNPMVNQTMMMDPSCSTSYRESMTDDKKPIRLWNQFPQDTSSDTNVLSVEPQNGRYSSYEEPRNVQAESAQVHAANDLDISEDSPPFSRERVK